MLTETIRTFIDAQIRKHPQIEPWLGDWTPDHETQIQIDTTGLEPAGDLHRPTHWIDDDGTEHRNIRIPYRAATNPTFNDRQVNGPIHRQWRFLGTTGWHWKDKKSMWVGFDFDSIAGHKEGLPPEQLKEVLNRAKELPYVSARTSKSGQGIHLLVYLDPQPTTRTHTEHAQLANFVINRMSKDCGFDFHAAADVGGGILWHWEKGLKDVGLKRID